VGTPVPVSSCGVHPAAIVSFSYINVSQSSAATVEIFNNHAGLANFQQSMSQTGS